MKESYVTLVRHYYYKGHEYVIVKGEHDGIIRAINYKYIDSSGILIKPLNGLEMFCDHYNNTVDGVIKRINTKHDFDEYISENGIDRNDDNALLDAIKRFFRV